MIFYIHGFNSLATGNPKIQEVENFTGEKVIPLDYVSGDDYSSNISLMRSVVLKNMLFDNVTDKETLVFLGTSLGGYYAAMLASLFKGKAVMLNPALYPSIQLKHFLGENINFSTQEKYVLREKVVESYPSIEIPEKVIFFINKNDELIPSEETVSFVENKYDYVLFPDGGHRFDSLEKVLVILKEKSFL